MRRLGFLLASVLIVGGLSTPAYAGDKGHQLPRFDGQTFLNYGPHGPDAVVAARTSTAVPGVDVGDDTTKSCTTGLPTTICVWYAANPTDSNAPTMQYVHDVVQALQKVETTYLQAGYRAVEPSRDPNPTYAGTMNVYLHDLGATGLYGFTAPDSGSGQEHGWGLDRAAYMVLDNDFRASQYPDANGFPGCSSSCSTAIMQVTVAHEFFHATQFAYDALTDDRWFMESTATWAETQVYPALHDNWLYFNVPDGVLTRPWVALDDNSGSGSDMAFYQNFAWIQFLGQRFPTKYGSGSMPAVIRNAWEYSSARSGRPEYFSVTALSRAIGAASRWTTDLPTTWLAFSTGNRRHVLGAGYPISRAAWSRTVTPSNLGAAKVSGSVNHLSSQTFVLTPQRLSPTEHVRLSVRVANQTGTVAAVTMYYRNGSIRSYPLTFSNGAASGTVGFDNATLLRVELTIGNAASRYTDCWSETTDFACDGGTPTVDKVGFSWTGSFYHL